MIEWATLVAGTVGAGPATTGRGYRDRVSRSWSSFVAGTVGAGVKDQYAAPEEMIPETDE